MYSPSNDSLKFSIAKRVYFIKILHEHNVMSSLYNSEKHIVNDLPWGYSSMFIIDMV